MSAQTGSPTGSVHAVRFYDGADSLCRIVAGFLADGLEADQPALAIATPDHLVGIVEALGARDLDIDTLTAAGDLLLLDAEEMLATFMVDGMPDPDRFNLFGVQVIERACHGRRNCTIRAYGEMVDVLWKQGQAPCGDPPRDALEHARRLEGLFAPVRLRHGELLQGLAAA